MVGLVLAPLKVPRRAVRILVLTVRSTTARRQATPPCWPRARPLPAHEAAGGSPYLVGVESGSRSVTQLTGSGSGNLERTSGYAARLIGIYAAA